MILYLHLIRANDIEATMHLQVKKATLPTIIYIPEVDGTLILEYFSNEDSLVSFLLF